MIGSSMPAAFYQCFCSAPSADGTVGAWRRRGCPWCDRESSLYEGSSYRNQLAIHVPAPKGPAGPACSHCGRAFNAGETFYDKDGVLTCLSCALAASPLAGAEGASQDEGGVAAIFD